ncbi:hypothetical protein NCW_00202 [Burkholderia pseudomallei]
MKFPNQDVDRIVAERMEKLVDTLPREPRELLQQFVLYLRWATTDEALELVNIGTRYITDQVAPDDQARAAAICESIARRLIAHSASVPVPNFAGFH